METVVPRSARLLTGPPLRLPTLVNFGPPLLEPYDRLLLLAGVGLLVIPLGRAVFERLNLSTACTAGGSGSARTGPSTR